MSETNELELPIGIPLKVKDGDEGERSVVSTVTVREFTGEDKVDVYAIAKRNPVSAAIEFVKRVLVEPQLSNKQVERLITVADRDVIMMESYRLAKGDDLPWETECRDKLCRSKQRVEIDLAEIDINDPEEDFFTLVGMEFHYTVKIEGVGQVTLKYPTSYEIMQVGQEAGRNELEATYQLYSLCLRKYGDVEPTAKKSKRKGKKPTPAYDLDFVKKEIPPKIIDRLEKAIHDASFGPERLHSYRCEQCNREVEFIIDMMSFLFLNPLMK